MAIADPGEPWTVDDGAVGRTGRLGAGRRADAGGLPARGAVRARARPAARARRAGARPAGEGRPARAGRRVRPSRAAPRDGAEGERGGARDARRRAGARGARSARAPAHAGVARGDRARRAAAASGCPCGASTRRRSRPARATPSSPPTSGRAPRATARLSAARHAATTAARVLELAVRDRVRPHVSRASSSSIVETGIVLGEPTPPSTTSGSTSSCRGSSRPRRAGAIDRRGRRPAAAAPRLGRRAARPGARRAAASRPASPSRSTPTTPTASSTPPATALHLSTDGGRFWRALEPELPDIEAVAWARSTLAWRRCARSTSSPGERSVAGRTRPTAPSARSTPARISQAWWVWKDRGGDRADPLGARSRRPALRDPRLAPSRARGTRARHPRGAGELTVIPAGTPFRGYRWPRAGEPCQFLAGRTGRRDVHTPLGGCCEPGSTGRYGSLNSPRATITAAPPTCTDSICRPDAGRPGEERRRPADLGPLLDLDLLAPRDDAVAGEVAGERPGRRAGRGVLADAGDRREHPHLPARAGAGAGRDADHVEPGERAPGRLEPRDVLLAASTA